METIPFRILDIIAIVIYLAAVIAIGFYFASKNKSTEEYFVGNRSFAGWVIGLSLVGTSISSITFLAFPAAAYSSNWQNLVQNFSLPLIAIFAVYFFIPFFRQDNLISAFEYLEKRFGSGARIYGAISFIFMQLLRIGTVLCLVSILIHTITGINITTVIIFAGIFIGIYSVVGGIDTVIWTDVIQTITLVIGGLVCFLVIAFTPEVGISKVFTLASEHNKFSLGSMDWDIAERTFWTLLLLGVFNFLTEYSCNQNVVQRYAAAKSTKEAQKATLICAFMSLPIWIFFFFLGTCLFAFYQVVQADLPKSPDQVFPFFIVTQLPQGVAGIVIAGVLAAAMSTLDSGINSSSTVFVIDIWKRHVEKERSDSYYLTIAKRSAAMVSVLMIAFAVVISGIERKNMLDFQLISISIFGGCLVGIFMLGFFTTRVHYKAIMIALVVAILFNIYLAINSIRPQWLPSFAQFSLAKMWIATLVNIAFVILAFILSLFGKKQENLENLTIWTRQ